jgi:hypothetical protein
MLQRSLASGESAPSKAQVMQVSVLNMLHKLKHVLRLRTKKRTGYAGNGAAGPETSGGGHLG